jgi:transcriptional regulator GlxA family with amidase domain
MERPFTIVFILFPQLTQLDFTGPFEVLQRLPGARLVVASREGGSLSADSGLTFAGLARLSDITEATRVVRDGNVITGGGVTAGIDFALTLVAEIAGEDVARSIQLSIEYDPQPPFDAGSPETAPAEVVTRVRDRALLQVPERRAALLAARAALARPV